MAGRRLRRTAAALARPPSHARGEGRRLSVSTPEPRRDLHSRGGARGYQADRFKPPRHHVTGRPASFRHTPDQHHPAVVALQQSRSRAERHRPRRAQRQRLSLPHSYPSQHERSPTRPLCCPRINSPIPRHGGGGPNPLFTRVSPLYVRRSGFPGGKTSFCGRRRFSVARRRWVKWAASWGAGDGRRCGAPRDRSPHVGIPDLPLMPR